MFDSTLTIIAAALLVAGFVKGALGLGLPTVAMGLLAVSMTPAQAIAIVIVPAIVTNIWQTFGGPYFRDIIRRLWPLLIGTAAGIWLNAGSLTGPYARYTAIALGVLLVANAAIGLSKLKFSIAPQNEKWVGGVVGVITGMVSAATGVQVIPSMPFMQAIGIRWRSPSTSPQPACSRRRPRCRARWRWRRPLPGCSPARRCGRGCGRRYSGAGS